MAFSEAQRVRIRRFMGWPQASTEPNYDSQITRIQSIADGGNQPDGSAEDEAKVILTDLGTVEEQLRTYWGQMEADKVSTLRIDSGRAMMLLRSEGRRLVRNLAVLLDAPVHVDVFLASILR